MKCKNTKLTRICALKKFLGNVDDGNITVILLNKYNLVASVVINNKRYHYVVITEFRFNVINNRIAYPERFTPEEASRYRSKIITGYKNAVEFKVEFDKSQTFYIYRLPIIFNIVTNITTNKIYDDSDLIDSALNILINNNDLKDQFRHKLREVCKDIIQEANEEGQLMIINSQIT